MRLSEILQIPFEFLKKNGRLAALKNRKFIFFSNHTVNNFRTLNYEKNNTL